MKSSANSLRQTLVATLVVSLIALVGCAGASKSKSSSEYTSGMSTQDLDLAKISSECPSSDKSWVKYPWKELIKVVNVCVKGQRWDKVEKMANHLAKTESVAPWGSYYLSLLAESQGSIDRALWMADAALKKAPDESILMYQKGRLLWKRGELELSVELMERALSKNSRLASARLFLAKVELRDQQYSKAYALFSQAVIDNPKNLEAHMGMAECLTFQNKWPEAVTSLDQAIDLSSRRMDLRLRRAEILAEKLNSLEESLSAYKKIRSMSKRKLLVGQLPSDIDDKINGLEKRLAAVKLNMVSTRQPAEEKKVAK